MKLIPLSPAQRQALVLLQQQLRQWNSRCNLTRLVEGDDYWVAQVQDSLWPLTRLDPPFHGPLRGVDVGTGGGIPGLVLAIALPQSHWVLVDSVQHKCTAVQAMANALGLKARVEVVCERAEVLGQDAHHRGRFDLAVARGVAAAPVVAEYLAPLLGPCGLALLYRGVGAPRITRPCNGQPSSWVVGSGPGSVVCFPASAASAMCWCWNHRCPARSPIHVLWGCRPGAPWPQHFLSCKHLTPTGEWC